MVKIREKIRVRREKGLQPPWSKDEILNNHRFTNVFREHDKVTKAVRRIYGHKFVHSKHGDKYWVNFVMARIFNNPDTMEKIGIFKDNWVHFSKKARKILLQLNREGTKMYNPAYIIRGQKGETKSETYFRTFRKMVKNQKQPEYSDIKAWSEFLISFPMIGDFLANQIICDMKYFYKEMYKSDDFKSYVLAGPGTLRGLDWLFGNVPKKKVHKTLMYVNKKLIKNIPEHKEYFKDPNTVANCLCEFDKYMKKLSGTGRPKQKYVQEN